jgi:hypothetical protein
MITYMHVEENTDTTTDTYTKSTGIKGLITTLDVQCMIVTQAAGVERGKKYDTPGTYKYISAIPIAYSPLQRHLPPRHSAQTRPPMPTYKTYPSPPAREAAPPWTTMVTTSSVVATPTNQDGAVAPRPLRQKGTVVRPKSRQRTTKPHPRQPSPPC